MPRLVCIADTHNHDSSPIPPGDILVVAGDLTMKGTPAEMGKASTWLGKLRAGFKAVVLIAGNHDWLAERDPSTARLLFEEKGLTYLHDQAITCMGIKFYGSPYTPRFYDWAFNVDRGPDLARIWSRIPDDTNVLITHGPPMGTLDGCERMNTSWVKRDLCKVIEHVGCADLARRITKLKDLKAHVFGHVHRPGLVINSRDVTYINASVVNEAYNPVHEPRVLDI